MNDKINKVSRAKTIQLTKEQQAQIYCVKHGHADYIWNFFGYVHCGRCGQQIGDRLGGYFDTTNKMFLNHDCKTCNKIKKQLSKIDKEIVKRLEKWGNTSYDYAKILEGIKFQ